MKIGDKVFWNDPDEGACSGEYTVNELVLDETGDVELVRISTGTDDITEVLPEELTAVEL